MRSRGGRSPKVMIIARRRSFQLAMNSSSVAKNSRNSVKVGDRNSSVGCTHSNFGIWSDAQRVGAAEHGLQLVPQRQRPVEDVQLVLQPRAELRQPASSIPSAGEAIRPTMKVPSARDRDHDQDRADARGMR